MEDLSFKTEELLDSDGNIICKISYQISTVYRNLKGQYHRIGGPALIWHDNNDRSWWQNGKLHREDATAIEYGDKRHGEYFLEGENLTKEEFYKRMVKRRSKKLKSS